MPNPKHTSVTQAPTPEGSPLNFNLGEPAPAGGASEFLRDAFDKQVFGDVLPTTTRVIYGPDSLLDDPQFRAHVEKFGLEEMAALMREAIRNKGANAMTNPVMRKALSAGIAKFGVDVIADAFAKRVMEIPRREVEVEVDREFDDAVLGGKVLGETVDRYSEPGMAYKFLSARCIDLLGLRGYEIVKDLQGDPVKVGTLLLGKIPKHIAEARQRHWAEVSKKNVREQQERFYDQAAREVHQAGAVGAGSGPLGPGEVVKVAATERDSSLLGQERVAGVVYETAT